MKYNYRPRTNFRRMVERGDIRTGGGIRQLIDGLPLDTQDWLIGQTPEGSTLQEVIRAIIVDAHYDDREGT